MSAIDITGLRKHFGGVRALDGIDLTVESGESLVVLGPSGSGKSTLLRVIAGLEEADGGWVRIGGAEQEGLAAHQRDVAIVFQHFALYPHLSVLTNITLGLRHGLKLPAREAERRARDVSARLEISELLGRLPRQLSGGQRQRVALARALARKAGVVLLDEPLSGLDAQLRQVLRVEIGGVLRATGATTVHVTHDQMDAMAMADRIAVVRAGRVEQVGSPDELYHFPATEFVAGFLGTPPMNLLPLRRGPQGYESPFGLLDAREPDRITLGIRPERLRLASAGTGYWSPAEAVVTVVESTGPAHIVHAELSDGSRVSVHCTNAAYVRGGERVNLACDPRDVHVFAGDDGRNLCSAEQLLAVSVA